MSNHHFTVNTTSDLMGSIPAMLGYAPQARIIAVNMHRPDRETTCIRNLAAVDLAISSISAAKLAQTMGISALNTASTFLVAVAEQSRWPEACAMLAVIRDSFTNADVPVMRSVITESLTTPGLWTDLDSGETGPVSSWADHPITAQTVFDGHPVLADRNQIVDEFAETEPAVLPTGPGHPNLAAALSTALSDGSDLTAEMIGEVGAAITANVRARDALMLGGITQPNAAAAIWTRIAAQLRGVARIEALIVAAALYYAGSEAVRCGIALEVADNLATHHEVAFPRLGELLRIALNTAITPQQITDVLLRSADRMAGQ